MALCTSQFNERVGPNVLNVLGPPLNCGYKILQKPRVNTFVITQNPVLSGPNNANNVFIIWMIINMKKVSTGLIGSAPNC